MNLKTLINNILFKESDPEKVASRLNILVSNKVSLKDIDNLLNSLKNQIRNNKKLQQGYIINNSKNNFENSIKPALIDFYNSL